MATNPVQRVQQFFGIKPATAGVQFGHTAQVKTMPEPRVDQPTFGQTGRANYWGLPQWDEINAKLVGPAGQALFDQMYRSDPDIRRLVLMISSPIQAGSWTLNPYGGDDASDQDRVIAETIWWGLNHYMTPNFQSHLSEALPLMIRAGFAPFEQVWSTTEYQGKQLTLPKSLQVRLPRSIWRWWQDDFGQLTHIGQIIPQNPQVIIPASELVYYRLGGEGDNWMGVSMLRSAYKPWMIKDKLERIDAIGQERKAVGVPIIYPPMNADEATKAQVETVVASMHTNEVSYLMSPGPKQGLQGMAPGEGWLFEVITFDSSSGDSIQASLTYHQLGIASSFLGDFMQLGHHQVGARATADVQEDPFLTAVDAFAQVGPLPPLNALVDRIRQVNWPDAEGSPTFTVNLTDAASLSEIAAYVQLLISAGAMNADPELEDWLRERADLPPANADVRALKQEAQEAALKASALQAQGPQIQPSTQTPPTNAPEAKQQPAGAPATAPAYPGKGKQLGAAPDPPNLRLSKNPGKRCGTCKMFDDGECWGYGDHPVSQGQVCDSWSQTTEPAKTLDAPSAKWYENLLSQGKLKEALDGARSSVEANAGPAARDAASILADGRTPDLGSLTTALTGEYERLYVLGHQTVNSELDRQRAKTLMTPQDVIGAAGARLARARQRGEHSAKTIAQAVTTRLRQADISGLIESPARKDLAQQIAIGQLHQEAMNSAAASINDGRWDAASQAPDVVGAYYTSVLDENTCDDCEADDTGDMISLDDASDLGPPNPGCAGGDRCRCMLVYVTSRDPTAVADVVG